MPLFLCLRRNSLHRRSPKGRTRSDLDLLLPFAVTSGENINHVILFSRDQRSYCLLLKFSEEKKTKPKSKRESQTQHTQSNRTVVTQYHRFKKDSKGRMSKKATFGGGCFWGVEKFFRKEFPKLKSTRGLSSFFCDPIGLKVVDFARSRVHGRSDKLAKL